MESVPSEVDKCYICDLLGDYEGFQDMKKQFDAQHDCWNKNKCNICDKKYDSIEELQIHKNVTHLVLMVRCTLK